MSVKITVLHLLQLDPHLDPGSTKLLFNMSDSIPLNYLNRHFDMVIDFN